LQSLPKAHKKKGETIAEKALAFYNQLYALERKSKHFSYDERYRYRQEHGLPVWKQFHDWLLSTATKIYDEKTRIAINYTIKHYEALTRYCEDGRLPISNIQCEHVAKTIAISRKNFLFCDTPEGAHASAKIYSIIETARANGHKYLIQRLRRLPPIRRQRPIILDRFAVRQPFQNVRHIVKDVEMVGFGTFGQAIECRDGFATAN